MIFAIITLKNLEIHKWMLIMPFKGRFRRGNLHETIREFLIPMQEKSP